MARDTIVHWNRGTLDRPAVCGVTLAPGTGGHQSGRAHMYLFYVDRAERCSKCEAAAVRELDEMTAASDRARLEAERDAVPCAKCGRPRNDHPMRHLFVPPQGDV